MEAETGNCNIIYVLRCSLYIPEKCLLIFKHNNQELERTQNLEGVSSENEDEEGSWSDWNDESVGITCLFCNYNNKELVYILRHMKKEHSFDFEETVKDLTFYQKVNLYVYIHYWTIKFILIVSCNYRFYAFEQYVLISL